MSEPKAAAHEPKVMEIEAGEHWWCACGLSNNQPFCDGSHAGTEFGPTRFTIEEKKTVAFCLCKRSGNQPFCDGSHASLKD